MTTLTQFDEYIKDHSLLKHYFYEQKWNKGELTLDELKIYAKEYFHLAQAVPGIVSRVRDRAVERQPELLEDIDHNIQEETEHIDLWRRFSHSLGVSDDELDDYVPTQKVRDAVTKLETLAEASFEEGVAAMYAMELDLPTIAKTKKDGLCEFYGLDTEDAHVYFDEHLNEEEHFKVWRKVPMDSAKAEAAVKESLTAQHMVLDGVCDACGMCMEC